MHEAEDMVALTDDGKMHLFPIKLYENDSLIIPSIMTNLQYIRKYQYKNADEISKYIISLIP